MTDPLYEKPEGETPIPETEKKKNPKPSEGVLPPEEKVLDRLKTLISAKVERPIIFLEVPERENVFLRVSPNITQAQMKAWRRNAGEESKNGLDPARFACQVIGQTCVGIIMDDEEVFDEAGNALNFAAPEVLEMTNAARPVPDAVRNFFGTDPHVEGAALAILEAAGYGDTVDTVDPTSLSSMI
jgi:hypothetical protein